MKEKFKAKKSILVIGAYIDECECGVWWNKFKICKIRV